MANGIPDQLISVIIPTLNEAENIRACLQAARQDYSSDEVEIIVVDGGSLDETLELIPKDVNVYQTKPSRAHQMNTGAFASHGNVLLFCHGDSRLPKGWRELILIALRDEHVTGGAFQAVLEPALKTIKLFNRIKLPKDWRFFYGDQGMFIRKDIFTKIGGFQEIPLMEDVELARAIAQEGKLVRINAPIITDSRRMLEKGHLRQVFGNAWRMISYLYLGVSSEKIASTYRSSREEK